MRRIATLALVVFCSLGSAASAQTALGDTLFSFNAGALTPAPDRGLFGVEFADSTFWVTGFNPPTYDHQLYQISADGTTLLRSTSLGSGYHAYYDLTFDGQFLWATDRTHLVQIDPATGELTGEAIPTDFTPYLVGGVAYDPATDRFWVVPRQNAQQQVLVEIDRDGTRSRTFATAPGDIVTSLSWDAFSPGGPYLWTFGARTVDSVTRGVFRQFSPALGTFTGVEIEMVNRSDYALDGPVGSAFSTTLRHGTPTLIAVQSGSMEPLDGLDWVVTYDADLTVSPQTAQVAVDPASITTSVMPGETVRVPVTISNPGDVDLTWSAALARTDTLAIGTLGGVLSTLDVLDAIGDEDANLNGLTFARGHYWLSGWTPTDGARLFQIDPTGTLVASYPIGGLLSSGWRTLATDGDRIFGPDQYSIAVWDIDSMRVVDNVFTGSISASGLAYDPDNEHFYVGGGSTGAIEVLDRDGESVRLLITPYRIEGLAWDDLSLGGPYLWAWAESDSTAACGCEAVRLDPETGLTTGTSFVGQSQGSLPDRPEAAALTRDLVSGSLTLLGLQETGEYPSDSTFVVAYDLAVPVPPSWIDFDGPTRGRVAPGDTGTLLVELHGAMDDTTTTARVLVSSNAPSSPRLSIPVTLSMLASQPVATDGLGQSGDIRFHPAAPNPFREQTALRFDLPKASTVRLEVLDVRGRQIARLVDGPLPAGPHSVVWAGRDGDARAVASGVYLAVLSVDGLPMTRRLLLVR